MVTETELKSPSMKPADLPRLATVTRGVTTLLSSFVHYTARQLKCGLVSEALEEGEHHVAMVAYWLQCHHFVHASTRLTSLASSSILMSKQKKQTLREVRKRHSIISYGGLRPVD
jgi:HJR/Mrr/RecB family endonuclease